MNFTDQTLGLDSDSGLFTATCRDEVVSFGKKLQLHRNLSLLHSLVLDQPCLKAGLTSNLPVAAVNAVAPEETLGTLIPPVLILLIK